MFVKFAILCKMWYNRMQIPKGTIKNKWAKVNLVKSHRGGKDYHDETVQEAELHYEG